MSVLRRLAGILSLLSFALLLVLTAAIGVAESPADFLARTTPLYPAAWIVLFALCALRPWLDPPGPKRAARYAWRHAPWALLCVAAAAAFLTSRTIDVPVREGESLPLAGVFARLGLARAAADQDTLRLVRLELNRTGAGDGAPTAVRSHLTLSSPGRELPASVEVNRPLAVGPVVFYQKSWSLGVRAIALDVAGTVHTFQTRLSLKLPDGRFLHVRPEGYDEGLIYRWVIAAGQETIESEGLFSKTDVPAALASRRIAVTSEDYALVSEFMASYKPWRTPLAVVAVAAILALGFDFWLADRIKRRKETR